MKKVKYAWLDSRSFEFAAVYALKTPDSTIKSDFLKSWKAHCRDYTRADADYSKELVEDLCITTFELGVWYRDKGDALC